MCRAVLCERSACCLSGLECLDSLLPDGVYLCPYTRLGSSAADSVGGSIWARALWLPSACALQHVPCSVMLV